MESLCRRGATTSYLGRCCWKSYTFVEKIIFIVTSIFPVCNNAQLFDLVFALRSIDVRPTPSDIVDVIDKIRNNEDSPILVS